jgi:titin
MSKVSLKDAGQYSFEAKNDVGCDIMELFVNIIVGPEIIENLQDMTILSGETLTLSLKVTGIPKPDLQWFKNDKPLEEDVCLKFCNEGDQFSLVYVNVSTDNEGVYTVKATNTSGTVESSAKVTILSPPEILEGLESTDVIKGECVVLKSCIKGAPYPSVSWFKDSVEIKKDDRFNLSSSNNIFSLEIKKSELSDSGSYRVSAFNSVGETSSSADLNILMLPEIKEGFSDLVLIEGGILELKCNILGVPKPNITWLKDETEIREDDETVLEQNDSLFSLKKSSMKSLDEGKYKLKVENKVGKTEASSLVTVLIPPSFDKTLDELTLLENDDLHIEVAVLGKPTPNLQWLKDDTELKPDKRTKINKKGTISSLTIKKLDPSDAGRYQCFLKSEAGENTTEANVHVHSKPILVKKMKDIVINEGEELLLEVQFKGLPQPDVSWMRDEESIPNNLYKVENMCNLLVIENINLADSGVYSAIAKNMVGDCKAVAKVKVVKAPFFEKSLSDLEVIEKQTMKLEAVIQGFPEPEVLWEKNGKPLSAKKTGQLSAFTIQKDGVFHSLNFAKVSIENEGVYSLTAKNQAGEVKCQATVVVQGT